MTQAESMLKTATAHVGVSGVRANAARRDGAHVELDLRIAWSGTGLHHA